MRAIQAITLRRRTASVHSMDRLIEDTSSGQGGIAQATNLLYSGTLFGPQVKLRLKKDPGRAGQGPAVEMAAEVRGTELLTLDVLAEG